MRYLASVAAGTIVALGLFFLMHALIAGTPTFDRDANTRAQLDFVRVKQDEIQQIKERRKPPEPEKPKEPPPPPKLSVAKNDKPPPDMPDIQTPQINVAVSTGNGPYLGGWSPGDPAAEGDVIPIVSIQPQYPRDAALNGIEGWVELKFTIEADGSVSDVSVVNSEPRRTFDRSAQRALYKWKFKPRVIDGQAVAREAVIKLDFNLSGG
ncbi:MAG: energy transducer TonB [Pseudomonadota bacterium]